MFASLEFIADSLDGNVDFDNNFDRYDLDSDGDITARDCPFDYGSAEAKLWWKNVLEPYVESQLTPEHGDNIVGVYKGKPLIPGEAGPGQGDFQYLVDKIRITHGLEYSQAVKIAGKVKSMMYGG